MGVFMWLLLILFTPVAVLVALHFQKAKNSPLYKLPGPQLLPFLGYIKLDPLKMHLLFQQFVQQYGPLTHFLVFGIEYLLVSDREMSKEILIKERKKFSKGPGYERGLGSFIGNSVLVSAEKTWSRQRILLKTQFNHETLTARLPEIRVWCREFLDRVEIELDEEEAQLKTGTFFRAMAMKVIGYLALGRDLSDYQKTPVSDSDICTHLDRCLKYSHIVSLGIPQFLTFGKAKEDFVASKKFLHDMVETAIKEKLGDGVGEEQKDNDMISWMLYHQKQQGYEWIDKVEVRDELLGVLFAGSDTTANATACALRMLAENPDVLSKVMDELESIDHPPQTVSEYTNFYPYLQQVIQETLRLWPSAPGVGRYADQDVKIGELTIPKGTTVVVSPWVLHRDKTYWGDDVDEFRPERFSEQKVDDGQWMPFVLGNRDCMGKALARLEMSIILPMFLTRFQIRLPEGVKPLTPEDLEMHATLMGKDGLPLLVEAW